MNVASARSQLEEEITWRQNEIRFFRNQMSDLSEEDKDQFRRMLIVMLYAHFEGFFKFSMMLYIRCVNNEAICCYDANPALVATAFRRIFDELFNTGKKAKEFKKLLPDDTKLHRLARQRDFIIQFDKFQEKKVDIPEDFIDTSNLEPIVLKKYLFMLGFDYEAFEDQKDIVKELLEYRNSIAHGAARSGIREDQYKKLEKSVFDMMESVMMFVVNAIKAKYYLKTS
jgi:hypothetical protein